jgi:hypothetical protein
LCPELQAKVRRFVENSVGVKYLTLEDYTVTVSSTGTQFESITPQLTLCFVITKGSKIEQHLSTTTTHNLGVVDESNGEGFGVVGDNEETSEHVTNLGKFGLEVFRSPQ